MKARIYNGDHQKSAEAMKLDEVPDNTSYNEKNQKRIAEE